MYMPNVACQGVALRSDRGRSTTKAKAASTAGDPDQFFLIVTVSVLFAPSVAPVGALSVTAKAWSWTEVARCWPRGHRELRIEERAVAVLDRGYLVPLWLLTPPG